MEQSAAGRQAAAKLILCRYRDLFIYLAATSKPLRTGTGFSGRRPNACRPVGEFIYSFIEPFLEACKHSSTGAKLRRHFTPALTYLFIYLAPTPKPPRTGTGFGGRRPDVCRAVGGFIYLFTYSSMGSSSQSTIRHQCICAFIHSFIHLFIYLSIHPWVRSVNHPSLLLEITPRLKSD